MYYSIIACHWLSHSAVATGLTAEHNLRHNENSGGGTSFWKPEDGVS